jgi:hypothetical protein
MHLGWQNGGRREELHDGAASSGRLPAGKKLTAQEVRTLGWTGCLIWEGL